MKAATELAAVKEARLARVGPSDARHHAQRGSLAAQELSSLQRSGAGAAVRQSSDGAAAEAPPDRQRVRVPPSMRPSRVRGLASSLALEEGLRSHWYPAHFASVSPAAFGCTWCVEHIALSHILLDPFCRPAAVHHLLHTL
jgi:hypothetical protein